MDTRKVYYYELEWDELKRKYKKKEKGTAAFHQFGINYKKIGVHEVQYSTAIIELPTGEIKNLPFENIKFDNPIIH